MTISDMQKIHGPALKEFIRSDVGQALLQCLHDHRMLPTCDAEPHQAVYRLGAIAGYEQCEKFILMFASSPSAPVSGPVQDYGVKEKTPES